MKQPNGLLERRTLMLSPSEATTVAPLPPVERPDKTWAAAVHISSIFWPIIGPVVGWVLFQKSRPFVASHAKQALLEVIVLNVLLFTASVASLTYTIFRIAHFIQTQWKDFQWQEFVIRFVVGFIALAILQLVNIIVSVNQARRAYRGDWPKRFKPKGY